MNYKQKLGYMALGAGILALGIIIGQVITPDIEAQNNGVFDKITCRGIGVIDKDGEMTILVQDGSVSVYGKDGGSATMSTDEHGGSVVVGGKDGGIVGMSTNEHGGVVNVSGKDGGGTRMGTGEHGGVVDVLGKDGGGAEMRTDEHGGVVAVFNNQSKPQAAMHVNAFGNGAVSTWDRNGNWHRIR